MNRIIVFHEAAEAEMNEAADYYDLEVKGLGKAFLDDIEKALLLIETYPEASPAIQQRVRTKRLSKFPFSLFYSLYPDEIRILAVAHQKRRPFYWSRRR